MYIDNIFTISYCFVLMNKSFLDLQSAVCRLKFSCIQYFSLAIANST